MLSGGAVTRMAIFALGIMPYISSAIVIQLLTGVSDYFKNLKSRVRLVEKNYSNYKIRNCSYSLSSGIWRFSRLGERRKFSN